MVKRSAPFALQWQELNPVLHFFDQHIVVIGQGSVDLPQRQMRMLALNLLGIPMMGNPVERTAAGEAGITVRVQISSTTDCPESKAATIVSKDDENAAIRASFRQLPSRTHRNRPASPGWLVR